MSKVNTLLPRAATTEVAALANCRAASRPIFSLLALTTVPVTVQPLCARNSSAFLQLVQPLRWYIQSMVPAMYNLLAQ